MWLVAFRPKEVSSHHTLLPLLVDRLLLLHLLPRNRSRRRHHFRSFRWKASIPSTTHLSKKPLQTNTKKGNARQVTMITTSTTTTNQQQESSSGEKMNKSMKIPQTTNS
jgi:hypothetical protein